MKFDRNKVFPYPVLRPYSDDYTNVEFQATVEFILSSDSVEVEITHALSSEDLKLQISAGNAKYLSVVSCRETYFRAVLSSSESAIKSSFASGSLRGEVRVDPYIIATKKIEDFKSQDINPEFGERSFSFDIGEVLAQEETQVFYVDRDLFKPVTSVFELVKNEALSGGEWKVGLDEDHVQIEVSTLMKDSIDNARNVKSNQVVLLNSIYFSAVVQALQRMRDAGADYQSKTWSIVIARQLHNFGWDLTTTEPYILAQRLMKSPLLMLNTYVFNGGDK